MMTLAQSDVMWASSQRTLFPPRPPTRARAPAAANLTPALEKWKTMHGRGGERMRPRQWPYHCTRHQHLRQTLLLRDLCHRRWRLRMRMVPGACRNGCRMRPTWPKMLMPLRGHRTQRLRPRGWSRSKLSRRRCVRRTAVKLLNAATQTRAASFKVRVQSVACIRIWRMKRPKVSIAVVLHASST